MRYVIEVTRKNIALDLEETLYYGTEGYATLPTDTIAHRVVSPRVITAALVRRDMWDEAQIGGASRTAYGELELRNDDGALDDYDDNAVDGRLLRSWIADDTVNGVLPLFPDDFVPLLFGTMEEHVNQQDVTRIRVRDRQLLLDQPFQPNTYGGTNVLPDGVDGINDIASKPLPRLIGSCKNGQPVLVNTSKMIYQIHDGVHFGPIRDVTAVYDSGGYKERDPADDYIDQADMEANEPAEGKFRVWKAGGMFRLSSTPAGTLTCDAIMGLSPTDRMIGSTFKATCIDAGIDPATISNDDVLYLNRINKASVSIYVSDATTTSAILDKIANCGHCWWGQDNSGLIRIGPLVPADDEDPVLSLTSSTIEKGSLKQVPMNDGSLPVWRVIVRGCPNYTVQTTDILGEVGAARRARIAQDYQNAEAQDANVLLDFLKAPTLTVTTNLTCLLAVQREAAALLAILKVRRRRFELKAFNLTAAQMGSIDLAAAIRITYDRFGLNAGKMFRVLGYQHNPLDCSAQLTVWG